MFISKIAHDLQMDNIKVLDLGNYYFIVKFAMDKGFEKALLEGSYVILGAYLLVQSWHPNFDTISDNIKNLVIWIVLPRLPFHLLP